jgi:hypothetical protein
MRGLQTTKAALYVCMYVCMYVLRTHARMYMCVHPPIPTREGEGEAGKNYRGPPIWKVARGVVPDYVACVFVFLGNTIIFRLYK